MNRITDKEVFELIEKIKTNQEVDMKDVYTSILELLVDTRILLRKAYQTLPKPERLYTDPTKTTKKTDVVIGAK